MENFFRRTGVDVPEPVRRFLQRETDAWLRVEEYRDGNTWVIRADMPGIDPDTDINISAGAELLHISASRRESQHRDQPGYRSEVRYGEAARSIPLPRGADTDTIEATYIDGVLEIRTQLPEQSEASATKIRVTRGDQQSSDAPEDVAT
jgi:HSP20 family protein